MKQVKHLLFAFLLMTTVSIQAQVGIGTSSPDSTSILDLTSTTKGLLVPRMTATQKGAVSSPATGLLIYQTDGTKGFYYHNGALWNLLTIDTSSLSNRINLKLNASDTSSLSNRIDLKLSASDTSSLSNRIDLKLNASDTFSLSSRIDLKLSASDTSSLSSRINLKLNASDTSSLSNRIDTKLNTSDTSSLSNRIDLKLNASDTSSLSSRIDLKLNASDTSSLSNRIDTKLSASDTSSLSSRINLKLSKTDTSYMLLNYRTALNNKLNWLDTTNMLAYYIHASDTSYMLLNYRTALNNKLNWLDTTNMLSKYLRKSDTAYMSSRIDSILSATHSIGESYGGGKVFYVTTGGLHGLIAETQDQSSSCSWYNAQNIISTTANHSTAGNLYTDWRLPTKYELNLLYLQKSVVGVFANSFYWSSTEYDYLGAWPQNFLNGAQVAYLESTTYYVRAIRAF